MVCVFGVFFVPDMVTQVAELWRMARPGGQLAVTTWGPDFFASAYELWLTAVRRVRPDLHSAFNPWDRITTPEAVHTLFRDAGIPHVEVLAEDGHEPLRSPEDFWTMARGSGLRWTIDHMGPEAARAIKQEVLEALAERGVDRVKTNVVYAVARAIGLGLTSILPSLSEVRRTRAHPAASDRNIRRSHDLSAPPRLSHPDRD